MDMDRAGDNPLQRLYLALREQTEGEKGAQGEYDRIIEILDDLEDSPWGSALPDGALDILRRDFMEIQREEEEHEHYLATLLAWLHDEEAPA